MSGPTASAAAESQPFRPATMIWLAVAGLLAGAGFFLLSTYGPDLRLGSGGSPSPLSKAATGYYGLYRLLELNGVETALARAPEALDGGGLLVVTLTPGTDREALRALVERRGMLPTLFVLPKWRTEPWPDRPGWVARQGLLPAGLLDGLLAPIGPLTLGEGAGQGPVAIAGQRVAAPDSLRWLDGGEPLATDADGHAVLAKTGLHHVLADPDLVNNAGLADAETARAALALLMQLRPRPEPVVFDLTLHGAGRGNALARLLVEPPFLAFTLTVLLAAALAVLHGFARFGPARAPGRAVAFGKAALADSSAELLRRAGRLAGLGGRYAALVRSRAAAALGAPAGLSEAALEDWLGRAVSNEDPGRFARLAGAARGAGSEQELQAAALALHDWAAESTERKRA